MAARVDTVCAKIVGGLHLRSSERSKVGQSIPPVAPEIKKKGSDEVSERLVASLCEMISIPSESGEEQEFIRYLADRFARELGAECCLDAYGNLIASIPSKDCRSVDPLMLAAHADTVKPGKGIKPVVKGGLICSSGDTILGADCKAGIAEIVEAVRTAEAFPRLEVVITREEEIGFRGAKSLDYSLLHAKRGFLVDMDALDTIVIGGPSHMMIDVEITGKAAHAGMEPEKGVSAIKAASCAIAIIKDGRIDHETTANVGVIQGGIIRNGVPDRVVIQSEVRSLNHDKCLQLSQAVKEVYEVVARSLGARAEVTLNLAYRAMRIPEDALGVKIAEKALESVGIQPRVTVVTAGLESAVYNEKGIEVIPLGNGVRAEHSTEENVRIEDMEKVVRVLHSVFRHFCS